MLVRRLGEADLDHLPRDVPLVRGLRDVEPFVALHAQQRGVERPRERLARARSCRRPARLRGTAAAAASGSGTARSRAAGRRRSSRRRAARSTASTEPGSASIRRLPSVRERVTSSRIVPTSHALALSGRRLDTRRARPSGGAGDRHRASAAATARDAITLIIAARYSARAVQVAVDVGRSAP